MPFGGHLQRRRPAYVPALVAWVALAVAVSGVAVYAVQADGYQAHTAELNDGGIWVTSNRDGSYGRINKPIGELDGTVFSRIDSNLDIVQDGSSVVGIDLSEGIVVPLDPAQMQAPDGEEAAIPGTPAVGMAGGSLAVLDTASGRLWATREDPAVGLPTVMSLADQTEPVATVGDDAALAVALDGTVYAVSAAEDQLLTLAQQGDTGFAEATADELSGEPFSDAIAVTAVGAVPVVLDAASGRLSVVGGAEARVPKGSVLQQPGPSASAVLVGARDALLSVDLATGETTTIADGVAGDPASPVRLGDCRYGAWAGGTGAVVTACGEASRAAPLALDSQTSDLVFRINRGQIVLNDRDSGHVWDIDSDQPTRLDNWDAFNLESKEKDDDEDDEPGGPGRPAATQGQEGQPRRPSGPHHDPAPARQRHRALRPPPGDPLGERRQRRRRRSSRSAPTARPCRSPCPTTRRVPRASSTSSTTAASRCRPTPPCASRSPVQARPTPSRGCAWASSRGCGPSPPAARSTSPCSPTGATPRTATRSSTVAAARGGRTAGCRRAGHRAPAPCASSRPRQGGAAQVEYDVTDGLGDAGHRDPRLPGAGAQGHRGRAPTCRAGRDRRRDRQADHDHPARQRPARFRPPDPGRRADARRRGRQRARAPT